MALNEGDVLNSIFQNRLIRNNKNCIVVTTGPTGCQPKGSKVLLSNGIWKNIEDIKVGDKILSPQKDGTHIFSKVTGTTNWFCDKMFNVVQKNKQHKKLYSCSYNHIIPVYRNFKSRGTLNGKRFIKRKWWDFSEYTAQKFNDMSSKQKSHQNIGFTSFAIPKFEGRINCEIEPYSLGVHLGDGMFYSKKIKVINKNFNNCEKYRSRNNNGIFNVHSKAINITSDDEEIIKEISKHYKIISIYQKKGTTAKQYAFSTKGIFANLLTKYNLEGKGSGTKFIPKEAMFSDLNYRKRLLAGLIDTDGYSTKDSGGYVFVLKSKRLIEDIHDLVYSIGGRCGKISKVINHIKSIGFSGEYYRISFYLGDIKLPVKLKRKQKTSSKIYLESNRIAIDTEETDSQMVYGIQLEGNSKWYITDNWMVTHNSAKSYSNMRIAELWYQKRFKEQFPIENICFGILSLFKRIRDKKNPIRKGELIILEEAGTSAGALDFQSRTAKVFSSVLQSFRSLNLCLMMNLPYFTMLNKQARELVHIQLETITIDTNEKKSYLKPFQMQINTSTGKLYRHFPKVVINGCRESIQFISYGLPSKELCNKYEENKQDFVLQNIDEGIKTLEEIDAKKQPAEKPLPRLQQAIWDLWQSGIVKNKDVAAKLMINPSSVSESSRLMRKKGIIPPIMPYIPKNP